MPFRENGPVKLPPFKITPTDISDLNDTKYFVTEDLDYRGRPISSDKLDNVPIALTPKMFGLLHDLDKMYGLNDDAIITKPKDIKPSIPLKVPKAVLIYGNLNGITGGFSSSYATLYAALRVLLKTDLESKNIWCGHISDRGPGLGDLPANSMVLSSASSTVEVSAIITLNEYDNTDPISPVLVGEVSFEASKEVEIAFNDFIPAIDKTKWTGGEVLCLYLCPYLKLSATEFHASVVAGPIIADPTVWRLFAPIVDYPLVLGNEPVAFVPDPPIVIGEFEDALEKATTALKDTFNKDVFGRVSLVFLGVNQADPPPIDPTLLALVSDNIALAKATYEEMASETGGEFIDVNLVSNLANKINTLVRDFFEL